MEKHLTAIIESKDKAILNLQLQVLQLVEANNKMDACNCNDCDCNCKNKTKKKEVKGDK